MVRDTGRDTDALQRVIEELEEELTEVSPPLAALFMGVAVELESLRLTLAS